MLDFVIYGLIFGAIATIATTSKRKGKKPAKNVLPFKRPEDVVIKQEEVDTVVKELFASLTPDQLDRLFGDD
jgi:hypothetical protein